MDELLAAIDAPTSVALEMFAELLARAPRADAMVSGDDDRTT